MYPLPWELSEPLEYSCVHPPTPVADSQRPPVKNHWPPMQAQVSVRQGSAELSLSGVKHPRALYFKIKDAKKVFRLRLTPHSVGPAVLLEAWQLLCST